MDRIPYEIADAFRCMGVLWAREQANADDEGVAQVESVVKALRSYQEHEATDGDDTIEPIGCCC